MLIGLPKEIKDNENRVGLTPGAVRTLTRRGHQVLVQSGAGEGSSLCVLMGGVPGVAPANVVILGAGIVGTNAARVAVGLDAQVTVLDFCRRRLLNW
jgi:alanine dehydrogenase